MLFLRVFNNGCLTVRRRLPGKGGYEWGNQERELPGEGSVSERVTAAGDVTGKETLSVPPYERHCNTSRVQIVLEKIKN